MKRRGAKLGQHFLSNLRYARELVRAADIAHEDVAVEIGPGRGALTRELLAAHARVIAVEKDRGLADELRHTFAEDIADGQLTLIEGDVRDFDPSEHGLKRGTWKLAANIPYYITGEILRTFLSTPEQPGTMALLVQKEVADRIVARDGKESILSLSVKAYGEPSVVAKVARGNFSPPPSVDSAILRVEDISRDFFKEIDEGTFFRIIRAGFSSKRKKLASNLIACADKERVMRAFEACGIENNARAEDVSLEKWGLLAKHL